jgi:hypothetical protein
MDGAAARRWSAATRLSGGAQAGRLAIFLFAVAILLHAFEAGGSFSKGEVRLARRSAELMEPKMDLCRLSASFAIMSLLFTSRAQAQQCDELVVWGSNSSGGLNNIPSAQMVATSSNYHLSIGLDVSGQIHCWGAPDIRASIPSQKGLIQVAAGNNWGLARDVGGTIVAWGDNSKGQCAVPAGTYIDMACGDWHTVALATDGTIRCWGDNSKGACNSPGGSFISIGAGSWHTLAVTPSGSAVGWGYDFGQLNGPPSGVFTKVSGGWKHSLGLTVDGSIRGWGQDIGGALTQIPQTGTYVAIDCSASRGLALRNDGRVVTWGSPSSAEIPIPDGRFISISAGYTVETGIRCGCRADLVVDQTVNAADMAIVLNFWGTNGSQFPGVDIDGDGIVSGSDLAAVLNAWGPCPQ